MHLKIQTNLLISFILFSFLENYAQPDSLWSRKFGGYYTEFPGSVQQTSDTGYILVGTEESFGGGGGYFDIWLIKTDSNGNIQWYKFFGGREDEYGNCVQQTSDGGYIILGSTESHDTTFHRPDIWLLKTDLNGDTIWTNRFGGIEADGAHSVLQTSDSGYIIAGWTNSFASGPSSDLWLIKTDEAGNTLWDRTFGVADVYEHAWSVQQTNEGGYIIAGTTINNTWLIKTDSNGILAWSKTFDGYNLNYGFPSVEQTSDGGYIAATNKNSQVIGDHDIWLIKTDLDGDTLWTKTFGGINPEIVESVKLTTDRGYIIIGSTRSYGAGYSDIWLIRTNSEGEILWTKTFGHSAGNEYGYSVQQTLDNGYILLGSCGNDLWLIKTSPDPLNLKNFKNPSIFNYRLHQNYPNPFNPVTTIQFDLPKTSIVSLKIFNVIGEAVATLVSRQLPAGTYSYEWDASNLASGVYLYHLSVKSQTTKSDHYVAGETDGYIETKKMILLR